MPYTFRVYAYAIAHDLRGATAGTRFLSIHEKKQMKCNFIFILIKIMTDINRMGYARWGTHDLCLCPWLMPHKQRSCPPVPPSKNTVCISDLIFFYPERFLKKLADDQCSSIIIG